MGRAKQLMLEMEEAQWVEADISFYCPHCQEDNDGAVELPVVYEHGGEEEFPVTVLCFSCSRNFEGWVQTDWDSCRIKLDDYPDLDIETSPARGSSRDDEYDYEHEYYEWLEQQEARSRPVFLAFSSTIEDVKALTNRAVLDQQFQMLARMLLAQCITALEVFLADTLILTVSNNKDAQARLLRSNQLGIGSTQFKLSDAISIEDFAKEKLLEHLRAVSFHNLNKVIGLFKVGLKFDIMPEDELKDFIHAAINKRHDCVHRNGVNRETGQVHHIDKCQLNSLTDNLLKVAKFVDEKVQTQ